MLIEMIVLLFLKLNAEITNAALTLCLSDCHDAFVGSVILSEMFCRFDWENLSFVKLFSTLTRAITPGWETTETSQLVA